MPKQRITKEMVVDAAFEIAKSSGMEQVLVKNIADRIGCSVQPIYSYCRNMDGLRRDVAARVRCFVREYVAERIDRDDLFRGTGRAYIRAEADSGTAGLLADKLGISAEQARQLHLNMLIYTIGIGTVFSVTTPGISADEIYGQQESAYEAFLNQAMGGKERK